MTYAFAPAPARRRAGYVLAESPAVLSGGLFNIADNAVDHGIPGLSVAFVPLVPYMVKLVVPQAQNAAAAGQSTILALRVKDGSGTTVIDARVSAGVVVPVSVESPILQPTGAAVVYQAYLSTVSNSALNGVIVWGSASAVPLLRAVNA